MSRLIILIIFIVDLSESCLRGHHEELRAKIRRRDVQNSQQDDVDMADPAVAVTFMRRFGYLKGGNGEFETLYSAQAVRDGLKKVQKFGNVEVTGHLDANTIKLLESPRCGNIDIDDANQRRRTKRYVLGPNGWRKRHLKYFLSNWSSKLRSEATVLSALSKAFQLWSSYSGLLFTHTKNEDEADIVLSFGSYDHGDRYAFDGPGSTLAHAFYPYEFSELGGDVHFDDDEDWRSRSDGKRQTSNEDRGTDFLAVAIHEIGHALGLSHSPVFESVMFPYYKGPEINEEPTLGYDDILALYELYVARGFEADEEWSRNDQRTTTQSTTTSTSTTSTTTPRTTTSMLSTTDESRREATAHIDDEGFQQSHLGSNSSLCSGPMGSIAVIRSELFVFRDEMVWRYTNLGRLHSGYPVTIDRMFVDIPFTTVDVVFERPDGNIVFVSGSHYALFDGRHFTRTRPLTDMGLEVAKVDAAFTWSKNDRVYLFSDDKYFKLNSKANLVEANYPMIIGQRWRGIEAPITAVFTWKDETYFLVGDRVWPFDSNTVRAKSRPLEQSARQFLLNCPKS